MLFSEEIQDKIRSLVEDRQRRLADHPWQCGYAGDCGKHAADRERHDQQGKDHGCQSDGAVGENSYCRIADTGRKDAAYQPNGAEDRVSLKAAIRETGRRAAAIA
jgi:hypothetical protein